MNLIIVQSTNMQPSSSKFEAKTSLTTSLKVASFNIFFYESLYGPSSKSSLVNLNRILARCLVSSIILENQRRAATRNTGLPHLRDILICHRNVTRLQRLICFVAGPSLQFQSEQWISNQEVFFHLAAEFIWVIAYRLKITASISYAHQ